MQQYVIKVMVCNYYRYLATKLIKCVQVDKQSKSTAFSGRADTLFSTHGKKRGYDCLRFPQLTVHVTTIAHRDFY